MNDFLLVIIIYNIGIDRLKYLETLADIDILIYDNSPISQTVSPKYRYVHDPSNPGVSTGYNYGLRFAAELNKKFVIILDQDTVFSEEILASYHEMKEKYGEDYIYAPAVCGNNKIYSPFIEKKNRNMWQAMEDFNYKEIYSLEDKSLINSGLMIPLKITDRIGGFNEKIKLDFSDIYFLGKYKHYKTDIILLPVRLEHSLSGDEGKNKAKELQRFRYYCNGARELKISSGNHAKSRRFIFFRTLRLIQKYKSLSPLCIVKKYYLGEDTI